jgi:hypothetical protein
MYISLLALVYIADAVQARSGPCSCVVVHLIRAGSLRRNHDGIAVLVLNPRGPPAG